MRRTVLIITLPLFFAMCSQDKPGAKAADSDNDQAESVPPEISEPSNQTLDELGASLILFLKENDFEKFTSFLPTKEDAARIATQYKGETERKKQLLLKLEENVKKIMIYSKTGFDEVFNTALKSNIVWHDVRFSHVEYDINKKDNLERASMTIFFVYNNLNYKIAVGECVHSERGWLITDKPEWEDVN